MSMVSFSDFHFSFPRRERRRKSPEEKIGAMLGFISLYHTFNPGSVSKQRGLIHFVVLSVKEVGRKGVPFGMNCKATLRVEHLLLI